LVYSYLQERFSFIDKSKTAIWGWSYGGYTAAMALTKDDKNVFKCGLSVAPVTDWIYYGIIVSYIINWYVYYLIIYIFCFCVTSYIFIWLNFIWIRVPNYNTITRFQTLYTQNVTWAYFKTTRVDTETRVYWHMLRNFVARNIWLYTARMMTTSITNNPWCFPMNWNEELYFSDNK